MSYTQEGRIISINTALGKDVLLLQGFSGEEGMSRLFRFNLNLLSEKSSISFADIVGTSATISLFQTDGSERYFNGYISRFAQSGQDDRFTYYQAEMVPWLWFLTRSADCRIFQNMTVPDILKRVFDDAKEAKYELSLTGTYNQREYCVQYRESHFSFVSRLMEQYGIFYFFKHTSQQHTLVLGDKLSACPQLSPEKIRCDLVSGGKEEEDLITSWQIVQELRTGKYSVTDYNFETPSTNLLSSVPTMVKVGGNSGYEIYDYPGEYVNKDQGENLAEVRMQEEEAIHMVAVGESSCRAFTSGYRFTLQSHYRSDLNSPYLLTDVEHTASVGSFYTSGEDTGSQYSNKFRCVPASVPFNSSLPVSAPFRPARSTPVPLIRGPQTAVVVGPEGEEIYVDKYGRVKVQFFWDRLGEKDEKSSCWIRVSQPWAGKNWGAMWIPRIGQEVIVEFLEGDPDRPIITGRVYNAEVMPPYTLPDHSTRSTFMSRSSKEGKSANYNELRFEDKASSEQIFMNAERDMDWRVEHDSREFVGNERHLIVKSNQVEQVQGEKSLQVSGDHAEKIEGTMSLQVVGDQKEKIGGSKSGEVVGAHKELIGSAMSLKVGGDQKLEIGGGRSLQVGMSQNEKVGMTHALEAGQTIHLKAGMTVIIEAGMEVALKGPGGFVSITPAGVAIQGTMVLINSGGAAGAGPGAQTESADNPDAPADPKGPDTADDGSKGGKLNS